MMGGRVLAGYHVHTQGLASAVVLNRRGEGCRPRGRRVDGGCHPRGRRAEEARRYELRGAMSDPGWPAGIVAGRKGGEDPTCWLDSRPCTKPPSISILVRGGAGSCTAAAAAGAEAGITGTLRIPPPSFIINHSPVLQSHPSFTYAPCVGVEASSRSRCLEGGGMGNASPRILCPRLPPRR